MAKRRREDRRRRRRKGGVLAEFALVAFVLWLLLAGVLELGRALSAQQILQHAARTIARELSQQALSHDASFADALRTTLDLRFLVIDSNLLARCGLADFDQMDHPSDLDRLFAERLPIGNRLLRPLMIRDRVGDLDLLRYPGALLVRTDGGVGPGSPCEAGSLYAVGIPRVDETSGSVRWVGVIEEEPGPDPLGGWRAGFALSQGGWVGVRLHYPFQSAAMPGVRAAGIVDPVSGRARQTFSEADRAYVDQGLDALGGALIAADAADARGGSAAYAGTRGLGRLELAGGDSGSTRTVRPWRRLLSATAGFRREIFLPAGANS